MAKCKTGKCFDQLQKSISVCIYQISADMTNHPWKGQLLFHELIRTDTALPGLFVAAFDHSQDHLEPPVGFYIIGLMSRNHN